MTRKKWGKKTAPRPYKVYRAYKATHHDGGVDEGGVVLNLGEELLEA